RPPLVALENPIVEEFAYLRNDLAANALHTALTNQNQRNNDLAIFELGRVFVPPPDGGWPLERHQLVILLKGDVEARSWLQRSRRAGFF
ncbi:MAG: hypothetical protein N3A57_07785, partial [Negativicutes bacterium]|nr:hypothetical protein [Negativicutes bacterium]